MTLNVAQNLLVQHPQEAEHVWEHPNVLLKADLLSLVTVLVLPISNVAFNRALVPHLLAQEVACKPPNALLKEENQSLDTVTDPLMFNAV